MNIGFDLDGIFIDKPPFIPKVFIERMYRKKSGKLIYRIPGKFEQKLRKFLHQPIFRPTFKKNIHFLENLKQKKNHTFFLISGRFGFLKNETDQILKSNNIYALFYQHYINLENLQPHLFKEKQIKKNNIQKFIDDDLDLLNYLSDKISDTRFYWLNSKQSKKMKKNLFAITHISKIFK